jgi:hypothetical protein
MEGDVDACHRACRRYVPGRSDRQRAGSAADVEDIVTCSGWQGG